MNATCFFRWKFSALAFRITTTLLAALVFCSPTLCDPIHKAAEKGDLEQVKALLKENPSLISSAEGFLKETPLHVAIRTRRKDVVVYLIANGADLSAKNRSGETPYELANDLLHTGSYQSVELTDILRLFSTPKADFTPLMFAALSCNEKDVTALLSQGADVKALDTSGNDALTLASVRRNAERILDCPNVVSALTKAGADPWSAKFYQNPALQKHQPSQIAVLRVEDLRAVKDDKTKNFAESVEQALSQNRARYTPGFTPHYPILRLTETEEKLKAAGFSDVDAMHPDPKRACSTLGVDAVFEAVLKDYTHHVDIGATTEGVEIGFRKQAILEYWLTDCRTGELLWKNSPGTLGTVGESRSLLGKAFLNSYTVITEQAIAFPRYQGPGK